MLVYCLYVLLSLSPLYYQVNLSTLNYAGDVFYSVIGLLEKNRDSFRDDMLKVLNSVLKDTK